MIEKPEPEILVKEPSDRRSLKTIVDATLPHLNFLNLFYSGLFAIAVGYFWLIDWRVRSIIKEDEFVNKVAGRTRPAMVFDQRSRIISDSGVLKLLEIMPDFGKDAEGNLQITIKPKEWMASEPIVESLDMGAVSIRTQRGIGNSWEVSIWNRYTPVVDVASGPPKEAAPLRFRLELTPTR